MTIWIPPTLSDEYFDPNAPLPPEFTNVGFEAEPYMTGWRADKEEKPGKSCPMFGEVFRDLVMTESERREFWETNNPNHSVNKTWQYDQRNEGTCTSNQTSGVISYQWTEQFGARNAIAPAPPSMYRYCASGPNSGSSVSCNLKRARDNGCLLIDNEQNKKVLQLLDLDPRHVINATGWNQGIPRGMESTAMQFRIAQYYAVNSVDEFLSALLHGFSVGYGRSGHSIHGADYVVRSGQEVCKYDNSWGDWGDQGFGYDTASYLSRTGAARGAYACQTVRWPDNARNLFPNFNLEISA